MLRILQRRLSSVVASETHSAAPERHVVLPPNFWPAVSLFWGSVTLFIIQDRYFTRETPEGKLLHPLTRMMLYYRPSLEDKQKRVVELMEEARQDGEVNVFFRTEMERPVKDPRFDARLLTQKTWAHLPTAQNTDHVPMDGVKWRRGYGEDEEPMVKQ